MAAEERKTSPAVATLAAKVLSNPNSTPTELALAGSALGQAAIIHQPTSQLAVTPETRDS